MKLQELLFPEQRNEHGLLLLAGIKSRKKEHLFVKNGLIQLVYYAMGKSCLNSRNRGIILLKGNGPFHNLLGKLPR